MIEKFESMGKLIHECPVPGQTRADTVFPAHPNGTQLGRDRWLLIYATRGFRGVDDDMQVVYQLRAGSAPDGPVLSEGPLGDYREDWDPMGDGSRFIKQQGGPVVWGVPKGAVSGGAPRPNANVFVASWRDSPRAYDPATNQALHHGAPGGETPPESYRLAWVQLRLNDAEDDIEILQPRRQLREKGYEDAGQVFCRLGVTGIQNQSFVQPVPYNSEATEWVGMQHYDRGGIAAVKFAWNPAAGLYEWTETGPVLNDPEAARMTEASIARCSDEWLVAARMAYGHCKIAWFRTADPFGPPPPMVASDAVKTQIPLSMFRFPDGVFRVLTTDADRSPYGGGAVRVPLHIFDIDPEAGFAATASRTLFDSIAEGVPIPIEAGPCNHFAKFLPHAGGREGWVIYQVRPGSRLHPVASRPERPLLTPELFDAAGIYYSKVTYDREYPPTWEFQV